jgi:hypothetical protein
MSLNYGMGLDVSSLMNSSFISSPYMTPMNGYMGLGTFGLLNGNTEQWQQMQQAQMQNMQRWDNFGINRQVQMFQNQNNAQFQIASQNSDIQRQIQVLNSQIKANNQDNIKTEYKKLLRSVEAQYGSQLQGMSDEQKQAKLKAYAEQMYTQVTGTYITDDIRANSSSSFVSGIKQVLSFGLSNRTTADENIAMIEGTRQTTGSKASKILGNVVAVATPLLALGAAIFGFKK